MSRRRRPRTVCEPLELRRLLTGYAVEPDSFDGVDLVEGAPGVVKVLDNTDDGFGTIDLDLNGSSPGAWNFQFYGQLFTQLHVSANGLITMVNGSTDPNNSDLTATPAPRTAAILWDDWDTGGGSPGPTNSSVLYRFDADRDELTIEWNNVSHVNVGGTNGVTFHAVLDLKLVSERPMPSMSNDKIEVHYKDLLVGNAMFDNGASATVGVKDAGAQGPNRLLIAQNGSGPFAHLVTSNSAFEIDSKSNAPVSVVSSDFGYLSSPHSLTFTFSQAVTNVQPSDLVITPVGSGTPFSATGVTVNGPVVTFTFAGVVPDGRYDATIPAGAISNSGGTPTTTPLSAPFFFLNGDANRDARVNLADFNILASNFGQSPRTFAQGDFTYDGQVNLADFNILAGRFGSQVAPAATSQGRGFGDRATAAADDDLDDLLA
jgi:hypothetical protein